MHFSYAFILQSLYNSDDERNARSKHVELYKDCRINAYKKCILLVCLCNYCVVLKTLTSFSFVKRHSSLPWEPTCMWAEKV